MLNPPHGVATRQQLLSITICPSVKLLFSLIPFKFYNLVLNPDEGRVVLHPKCIGYFLLLLFANNYVLQLLNRFWSGAPFNISTIDQLTFTLHFSADVSQLQKNVTFIANVHSMFFMNILLQCFGTNKTRNIVYLLMSNGISKLIFFCWVNSTFAIIVCIAL